MRTRSASRLIALLATTALMSGGLASGMLASPAHAAPLPTPTVTGFTPTSWDNRSSVNITVQGKNFAPRDAIVLQPKCSTDPALTAVTACPPLEGDEVGNISVTTSIESFCPAGVCEDDDTLSARFDLGQAAPGVYSVVVKHAFPDTGVSNPFGSFTIFAYGGANAISTVQGVGEEGYDPFFGGIDCDITNDGCGRDNGLTGGIPLDVKGANIAIGARVRFLLPNGTEDTGLEFKPGNPSETFNKFSTSDDTGYPSAALMQGMYRTYNDALTQGHAKFTPGIHQLQVLNTDGKTTGSTARFVQPWFDNAASLSRSALGRGAQGVEVTITGAGFWPGARMVVGCGSAGTATLSDPKGDGTYNKITAPVSIASNAAVGVLCNLGVLNTGGEYFGLPVLNIGGAPVVDIDHGIDPDFATLGQGARVGCDGDAGQGVTITGSNFVDNNAPGQSDPAKMTKFDLGKNITVTTRGVGVGGASASVCIEVEPEAATGRRDVTATNPDGGSTTTGQPLQCDPIGFVCEPDPAEPDADILPFTVNAGPKIASITPASFTQGAPDVPVHIVGTGFEETIVDADVTLSGTGMSLRRVTATETAVDLEISTTADAPSGPRTLTITNPSDHGRAVCTDCLSVDSLIVTPTAAANTAAAQALALEVKTAGLPPLTSSSTVTLTHQTPLPGQPAITANPVVAGVDAQHGTATVNLTSAALGKYNLTVVLDPASGASAKTVSCAGCFTVTGAAAALDGTTPVSPAKAGQGASAWKLTFKGTGFTKGMQVEIPDVTVSDVTFKDATELTALADVAPTATPGAKTGKVTSGDGTVQTFAFTVTEAPRAKSVTEGATYAVGAGSAGSPDTSGTPPVSTLPITVAGAGMDAASDTQVVLGDGVDVVGETVAPGSEGTCLPPDPITEEVICIEEPTDDEVAGKVSVAQTALQGKRAVKLVNPADGGNSTLAEAFTVTPGPSISSVANENGQAVLVRDGQKHAISFIGSALPTPATSEAKAAAFKITNLDGTAIPETDLKVENVVFTTTKITADVTAFSGRAYGPVRIAVYNATDKGFFSCTTCAAVANLPGTVPNLVLTPGGGSLTATWDAPAENGSAVAGYRLTIQRAGAASPTVLAVPASPRAKTFTGLTNGATYTVTVAAVNGVGTGLSSAKTGIAGLPSALSIRTNTSAVTYGTYYTLSGRLTGNGVGLGAKTVVLTFTPAVGSPYSRTVKTSDSATAAVKGSWSFKLRSAYTTKIKAQYLGDSTYRPVTSSTITETIRVLVKRTAPTNLSRSAATTTLTIKGVVTPNKKGKYAYLYRYVGGKRVLIKRVVLSSTSTFTFAIKPSRGTYVFRVFVPATTGNAANYSGVFTLYRT